MGNLKIFEILTPKRLILITVLGMLAHFSDDIYLAIKKASVTRDEVQEAYDVCQSDDHHKCIELTTKVLGSHKLRDADASSVYTNRGRGFLKQDLLKSALTDFEKAISLDPENAAALNNRGKVRLGTGEIDLALADFDEALKLNPKLALAFNNRGAVRVMKEQFDLALEDVSRALELTPDFSEAFFVRGHAYLGKEQPQQSIEAFKKALELKPGWANAEKWLKVAETELAEKNQQKIKPPKP